MDYPQKFCGQSQPHYAHRWTSGTMGGIEIYKNCSGYSSSSEERVRERLEALTVYAVPAGFAGGPEGSTEPVRMMSMDAVMGSLRGIVEEKATTKDKPEPETTKEERPCICSKNLLGYRMEANPKCPKHGISSEIEPPPDPEDTMTNEERIRAAIESASEYNAESWQYLRKETVDLITERVLEALNAKPLENAWYRGPNFMMYLMDGDGVCLMSAPVNSPVVNGDTIQFPPIKVSI